MEEIKTTLTYKGRTVEMTDDNVEAAMRQVGKEPVQMEIPFKRVYSDIALKEAMRGIKAIAKEAIRFGAKDRQVNLIMDVLIGANPIIVSAIDLMDEKLMGGD